jgi:hypothetical protein
MRRLWPLVVCAACGGDTAPDAPVAVLNLPASPASGEVTIAFSVSHADSRLVNASFKWGTSSAGATQPATAAASGPSPLGLATSPTGVPHTFVWDSVVDLGYTRNESIWVALEVTAGNATGVPDVDGPLVVDNTGLQQEWDLSGDVVRSGTLLGSPTGDLEGHLYVGLFANDVACPPLCSTVRDPQDLGSQDFSNTSVSVPYSFTGVPAGNYKIIAVLDHNDNIYASGVLLDAGDLLNANDMSVELSADTTDRDVVINYGYAP